MEQLSKTIIFYSKHVQDASFSPNIQTMCAKLLLTLCENVAKLSHKDDGTPQSQQALSEGRALFIHILETITCKITSLRIAFPVYCKYYHKRKIGSSSGSDGGGPANDSASLSSGGGGGGGPGGMGGSNEKLGGRPDGDKSEDLTAVPEYDGYLDLGFNQPIRTSSRPIDSSSDLIKDIRFLLKYIIPGVKTILTYLAKFNPPLPATADAEAWKGITYGFSDMEIDIFTRIARDGLQCFLYFNIDSFDGEGHPLVKRSDTLPSPPASLVKDEKDVLDAFAGIFMSIDQSIFQEVFSCQISFFLEQAVNNPQLFAIPQYFLASVNLSPSFSGLLLRYLVSNLDKLGGKKRGVDE